MKTKVDRSEKLRALLRAAHHAREDLAIDAQWGEQTMRRIRYLAAGRSTTAAGPGDALFWRWFAVGGVATAVMAVVVLNFQFIPDVDLWSFLLYENETMTMLQAFLY
jgi:hypothetical protein